MSEDQSTAKRLWRRAGRFAWLVMVGAVTGLALAGYAILTKTHRVPDAVWAVIFCAAFVIGIAVLSRRDRQGRP